MAHLSLRSQKYKRYASMYCIHAQQIASLKALLQAQMSFKKYETLDSYHWDPGAPAKAG